jgi:hypothetical protein
MVFLYSVVQGIPGSQYIALVNLAHGSKLVNLYREDVMNVTCFRL